jgi:hypothetical protein
MKNSLTIALPLLLAACASYDGRGLIAVESGIDDVVRVMGEPRMQWGEADGTLRLAYPRGPMGVQTYMVLIGRDGRLRRIENVMDAQVFRRIEAGMSKDQVLRALGPPEPTWTVYFKARDELVWEWRYCDEWNRLARFDVLFDGSKEVVRSTMSLREHAAPTTTAGASADGAGAGSILGAAHPIAARRLRLIEGAVRGYEQVTEIPGRIRRLSMLRRQARHADAGGTGNGDVSGNIHPLPGDSLAQPVGNALGFVVRRSRHQNGKLLAPDARHHIRTLAEASTAKIGNRAEHAVADRVSPRVVDALEMVDVEDQERQRLTEARSAPALLLTGLDQEATIGKTGQGIGGGEHLQGRIHAIQFRVLLGQPLIGCGEFLFPTLSVIDVERNADEALAEPPADVHDLAVVCVPNPVAAMGAQAKLAAILFGFSRHMGGNRLLNQRQVIRMDQGKEVVHVGHGFLYVVTQVGQHLGDPVGHLAGRQIVFPKVQPGRLKRQMQTFAIKILVSHSPVARLSDQFPGIALA